MELYRPDWIEKVKNKLEVDDPVRLALAIVEEDLLSMTPSHGNTDYKEIIKNNDNSRFSNTGSFDPSELETLLDDLTWNKEVT